MSCPRTQHNVPGEGLTQTSQSRVKLTNHEGTAQASSKRNMQMFLNKFQRYNRPFTVVCLVTWPAAASDPRGDLALIQTSVPLSCLCQVISIIKT